MIRTTSLSVKLVRILIIILFFQGCSSNNSKDGYQYANGVEWYLSEVFNMDINSIDREELLFINISCVDCMVSKVSFLELEEKLTEGFKIFFLGDTTQNALAKRYKDRDCEYDLTSKYAEYETGIYLPLYLKIEKGKIVNHSYVSDENMVDFIKMLYKSENGF